MSRAVQTSPPVTWSPSRGLARAQHTLGSQTTEIQTLQFQSSFGRSSFCVQKIYIYIFFYLTRL